MKQNRWVKRTLANAFFFTQVCFFAAGCKGESEGAETARYAQLSKEQQIEKLRGELPALKNKRDEAKRKLETARFESGLAERALNSLLVDFKKCEVSAEGDSFSLKGCSRRFDSAKRELEGKNNRLSNSYLAAAEEYARANKAYDDAFARVNEADKSLSKKQIEAANANAEAMDKFRKQSQCKNQAGYDVCVDPKNNGGAAACHKKYCVGGASLQPSESVAAAPASCVNKYGYEQCSDPQGYRGGEAACMRIYCVEGQNWPPGSVDPDVSGEVIKKDGTLMKSGAIGGALGY